MNVTRQSIKLIKDSHRGTYEQNIGTQAAVDLNVAISESMSYRLDILMANIADLRAETRTNREKLNRVGDQVRGLLHFMVTNGSQALPVINEWLAMQGGGRTGYILSLIHI